MASPQEKRLQIKEWTGVDRSSDGTATPQNRFYQIQNMHPAGPGELASIGGVSDKSAAVAADIPGVGKVLHSRFMRDAYNNPIELLFYRPSAALATWTPNVSITNFAKSGTTTSLASAIVHVVYVGPGGYTKGKRVSIASLTNATTITFTTPNDVPDWVAQIDIYQDNSGNNYFIRMASMRRRAAGTFQASVTYTAADDVVTDNSVTADPTAFVPDSIKSTHTAGSNARYERWFFGAAPFFNHNENKPIIALQDSATIANFLVAEVDVQNGSTIKMDFAYPKPAFGSGTRLRIGDFDILRMLPFAGRTPEDLVHVGAAAAAGVGNDVALDLEVFEYSLTGLFSSGASYTAVTGTLVDGDRILYRTNGGSITGLVDGTKYYMRYRSSVIDFYATFEDYLNDNRIALSAYSGTPKIFMQRLTFFVKEESLYNSRNNCQMIDTDSVGTAPYKNYTKDRPNLADYSSLAAIASRTQGIFCNHFVYSDSTSDFLGGSSIINSTNGSGTNYGVPAYNIEDTVGCWVLRSYPWSLANAHQLLPGANERSLSQTSQRLLSDNKLGLLGHGAFFNPLKNNIDGDEKVYSTQWRNKLYTANGDNILWHTNGYTWKPIMRDDGKAQIPQSRYVQAFGDNLVAAGGQNAVQNTDGVFYVSEAETPFDWGTNINLYSVFSKAEVNGLGVFSQNLTDQGYAHFLLISKKDSLFIWDGSDDRGPQQLHYAFGFAGPKAFAVTDFGPMFVARDNVWVVSGDKIQDIGDEVTDILRGLTDTQLARINVVHHKNVLKIAYPSGNGTDPNCDKELWFDFRTEEGELKKYISGPHSLAEIYDQDVTLNFNSTRAVRSSCKSARVYERDTGNTNDTAAISLQLILSRLALSDEHLKKLLTRVYLAVKVAGDETFTLVFECEDGTSSTLTLNEAWDYDIAARQLFQRILSDRFAGRINKLTLTCASSRAVSIFDLSLFFIPQKRATLRYP